MKIPKVLITGAYGMTGSAIMRQLFKKHGTVFNVDEPEKRTLDLRDQDNVIDFIVRGNYDEIYHCAGLVGGIGFNISHPAEMIYDNLMIQANVLEAARLSKPVKVLVLGSSCIYPKDKEILKESDLLTGPLEESNKSYAVAKLAAFQMAIAFNQQYGTDFRIVMPCNMYGPGDTYDLTKSHVIPALIMKFHQAKINNDPRVEIWGTGNPLREFMHVDDFATACIKVMDMTKKGYTTLAKDGCINVGSSEEITIRDLSVLIKDVVGFNGHVVFNSNKPDGTKRKLLDSGLIRSLRWSPNFDLQSGLTSTYAEYLNKSNND